MANHERPLSPHLQVYRPQLTSVLSILHRMTGVFLSMGTLLLTWWLLAAAAGPDAYAPAQAFLTSIIGQLLLIGLVFSVFYHLCNGIRHLFWDAGMGFEIPQTYRSGWMVVIAASILTVVAVLMSLGAAA